MRTLRQILIVSVVLGVGCKDEEDGVANPASGAVAEETKSSQPTKPAAASPDHRDAPKSSSTDASRTAPSIRMTHTHAVEPAADVAAARKELDGLKPEDPRWVEGQYRIALAHMDATRWNEALEAFDAAAESPAAPEHPHADEMLLDHGEAAMQAGQPERAQEQMLSMIRHHPHSPLIGHSYTIIADHWFDEGKLPEAIQMYQKLLGDDDPALMAYAAYRIGWCHLESDDRNDALALESFVKAVRTAAELEDDWGRHLGTTALEDATLVYARVGRADSARSFFTPIARGVHVDPDVPLRRLAAAYSERGDGESAAAVCRDLAEPC